MKLQCPACLSEKVDQTDVDDGPMWCLTCGRTHEPKNHENPFIVPNEDLDLIMVGGKPVDKVDFIAAMAAYSITLFGMDRSAIINLRRHYLNRKGTLPITSESIERVFGP